MVETRELRKKRDDDYVITLDEYHKDCYKWDPQLKKDNKQTSKKIQIIKKFKKVQNGRDRNMDIKILYNSKNSIGAIEKDLKYALLYDKKTDKITIYETILLNTMGGEGQHCGWNKKLSKEEIEKMKRAKINNINVLKTLKKNKQFQEEVQKLNREYCEMLKT